MTVREEISFTLLKIRSLIADKEHITAMIQADVTKYGELMCDYDTAYREVQKKLDRAFKYVEELGKGKKALDKQLLDIVVNGSKLKAIKTYRNISGSSLKEALAYIDKLILEATQ